MDREGPDQNKEVRILSGPSLSADKFIEEYPSRHMTFIQRRLNVDATS